MLLLFYIKSLNDCDLFHLQANDSHLIIESDKMLRNDLDIQKDEECTSGNLPRFLPFLAPNLSLILHC